MGGVGAPGSLPAPGPAAAHAPRGVPTSAPPRGLTGARARPRRPPCTPLCGSWRTTSATRCPCRACATSAPARDWILTTRRCTQCTGARRSWAPSPRAPRVPPGTGARCCSTRPRSWLWQVSKWAGRGVGSGRTGAGSGEAERPGPGSHSLLLPSLPAPWAFFWVPGVSKRPDQLKRPEGPLCLPCFSDTHAPGCQPAFSALFFLTLLYSPCRFTFPFTSCLPSLSFLRPSPLPLSHTAAFPSVACYLKFLKLFLPLFL